MTTLVLFILAMMWAAVLLPPYLRSRGSGHARDSIGNFRRQLSVLERTSPSALPAATRFSSTRSPFGATVTPMAPPRSGLNVMPMTLADAQRRRREVVTVLAGATAGAFLLWGVTQSNMALGLFLLAGALLGAYVVLLGRSRQFANERDEKVRYLPGSALPEPVLLRRSATS